jgi:putative hydrolase of the HAD superfamily
MSRKRPELLLFDASGTLIDLAEPVEQVYARYFDAHGWVVDPSALRPAFVRAFGDVGLPEFSTSGNGETAEREWWRKVVARTAESVGVDVSRGHFESCFDGLYRHYAAGDAWRVFPEVLPVLREAGNLGFRLAVVSNFDRRLHQVLDELDLTRYFDLVLTSADVGSRKPSPVLIFEAMRRLGARPETTSIVGDSEREDGGAAKAAGVPAFILNRSGTTLRNYLEWVSENFS